MQRILIILLFIPLISGCRYWVLYKFADQFCDFDQYILITAPDKTSEQPLRIDFSDPVLDRPVLLRYLNAAPFVSLYSHENELKEDEFKLQLSAFVNSKSPGGTFNFTLAYHLLGKTPLLRSAEFDDRLGRLFPPALVDAILRSICSDDYELSDAQLEMFFSLPGIDLERLPMRNHIVEVMGDHGVSTWLGKEAERISYSLDFVVQTVTGEQMLQNKPVSILFGFKSDGSLRTVEITYYKYQYWLDIENRRGRLLVTRS